MHHTVNELGWTCLSGSVADVIQDTASLKLLNLMKEHTAARNPDAIGRLCLALLQSMDGLRFAKLLGESRVWFMVGGTQYIVNAEGLKGEEGEDEIDDNEKGNERKKGKGATVIQTVVQPMAKRRSQDTNKIKPIVSPKR